MRSTFFAFVLACGSNGHVETPPPNVPAPIEPLPEEHAQRQPEPQGGTCASPIELVPGVRARGAGPRVYRFDLPSDATVRLDASHLDVGASVEIFEDCAHPDRSVASGQSENRMELAINASLHAGRYDVVMYRRAWEETGGAPPSEAAEPTPYELMLTVLPHRDAASLCAAAPVLRSGQPIDADTSDATNVFRATNCPSAGPDQVYALDLDARSHVVIEGVFGYEFASLYLRRECNARGRAISCGRGTTDRDLAELSIDTVLDPGRYYVFADGAGADNQSAGSYQITARIEPAGAQP